MRRDELVAEIVGRTHLTHDIVWRVIWALRDIIYERVGCLEYVIIPDIGKVGVRCNKVSKWVVKFSPLKGLAGAVGRDFIHD